MFMMNFFANKHLKNRFYKKFISSCVLLILMSAATFSAEQQAGFKLTALDHYVKEPDPNYSYSIIKTIDHEDYDTFIIEMTSQKWFLRCLFVKKFIINIVKFQYILELDLQLQRVTSVRFHSRLLHKVYCYFPKTV